jgi:hypothetical protein
MKGEVNPDAYLKSDSMKLRSYFGLIMHCSFTLL